MKKKIIFIASALICILLLCYCFSFPLCALVNGYRISETHCIDYAYDANGKEFRVIQTRDRDDVPVLAVFTKNSLGFFCETKKAEGGDVCPQLMWSKDLSPLAVPGEWEWHSVYYGTDAIAEVKIFADQIPDNVIVSVSHPSVESDYMIHCISYDAASISGFDVRSVLKENGCIE
ncbi:MAG: hypothetical protein IJW37_03620 [Lachnospiraceae bacterium]|nr:hypothetical protein [Lachnospiraceae bacterium]